MQYIKLSSPLPLQLYPGEQSLWLWLTLLLDWRVYGAEVDMKSKSLPVLPTKTYNKEAEGNNHVYTDVNEGTWIIHAIWSSAAM